MEVTLDQNYQNELKKQVKQTLMEAVEEVQHETAINSPFIKGKRATAKWLGCSLTTLEKLIKQGLQVHYISDDSPVCFFNKKEVSKFILEH